MILTQALSKSASKNNGAIAILDLDKKISYSEMTKRVAQLSYLYQTELAAGDIVAIFATNTASVAITFFALSNIGNPILFLDPADPEEKILRDFQALNVRHLLVTGDHLLRARELVRKNRTGVNVIELEKKRGGEYDKSFTASPERPLSDNNPVLILRSEIDGEENKYLFFNHKKIYTSVIGLKKFYRMRPNDKMLGQVNWSHPFGLTHGMLLPLFTSATCVVDPQSPTVEEFVEFIAKNHITRFSGPPTSYLKLLSHCAAQKYTLPGVQSITVGMGSLSLMLRKTYHLLKIPILRCYGRAETMWSIAMDPLEEASDIQATMSRPLPGLRCKVLDENGDEIPGPDAREGVLAVMGESVMERYFLPDEKAAAAATRQALRGTWFYTQDIARLTGEGENLTVTVLGRACNLIASANTYLLPQKIDLAAKGISGVADAAAFVHTDRHGNRSFACAIVPERKGLKEQAIAEALSTSLPAGYRPSAIFLIDAIPKDTFGSVNRQALQRMFFVL